MGLRQRIDNWIFGKIDEAFQPKPKPPPIKGHDWEQWEDIKTYKMTRTNTNSIIGGSIIQERKCKKCGFGEYREHGWGNWK